MSKPLISVVVLAKNNASTLPRLIESLREFRERGGEMILVDTGSEDGTQKIAMDGGFLVHHMAGEFDRTITAEMAEELNSKFQRAGEPPLAVAGDKFFDFAKARNWAAGQASNDWICNPDSDEVWTKFDIDKVEALMGSGATRFSYNFVYDHNPDGTPSLQFVTDTRLYNKKYWHWECCIHETLTKNAGLETEPVITYVGKDVLFLEHWQVPSPTRKCYLPGMAVAVTENPNHDRHLHYFGRELYYYKRYQTAIQVLMRHIELSTFPNEKAQSMIFIGDALNESGQRPLAIEWYHKAFQTALRREPLMRLAQIYFAEQDPLRTCIYCEAALKVGRTGYYGDTEVYYGSLPYQWLSWAKWNLGDKEGAKAAWKESFVLNPTDPIILGDKQWYF